MIKQIAEDLEDINIEKYYNGKGAEWCANLILMRIEESGMLPPPCKHSREVCGRTPGIFWFDVNEWEPEKDVD